MPSDLFTPKRQKLSGKSSESKKNETGENLLSMFNASNNSSGSRDKKVLALVDDNVFADPEAGDPLDQADSDAEKSDESTPNFLPLAFQKIKSVVASVVTKLSLPFFN